MTSSQQYGYRLNHPGTLIAAVPAVLGFVPEQSLVLVTVDCGALGAVLRVDLSDGLAGSIGDVVAVVAGAAPDGVVAVIVDDCGADCSPCHQVHRHLVARLNAALAAAGIGLLDAHVVDRIAVGGRWHSVDDIGVGGPIEDPSSSPLAAAAVLEGRRLYRRRAELEAVIEPDPDRAAELLDTIRRREAVRRASDRSDQVARREVEDALALSRRLDGGRVPEDEEVAALACALTDPAVRDTLYALAIGRDAAAAESLWLVLSRALPPPWRTEALVLLAFSAYARGDGPLAGVALEAALDGEPRHRMAGMLDQALRCGMRPDQIRELALTGYRTADRLGVRLPPRSAAESPGGEPG